MRFSTVVCSSESGPYTPCWSEVGVALMFVRGNPQIMHDHLEPYRLLSKRLPHRALSRCSSSACASWSEWLIGCLGASGPQVVGTLLGG